MKSKKQTLSNFVLSTLLVLTLCFSLCACGQKTSPVEDFEYEFENGEVTITGYKGSDLDIVIPDKIEERPVTVIGEKAFEGYDMESITIPYGITKIEYKAFEDCVNLKTVNLPDSLTEIDGFSGCESLEKIKIPDSVTGIGDFAGCKSLTEITLPDSITGFSSRAFMNCTNLKSINIPKNIDDIPDQLFYGCESLTEIVIPDGVSKIHNSAFGECINLESAIIPSSVIMIADKNAIGNDAFYGCDNLTIYGDANSEAEEYAQKYGIPFVVK